ncbi:MAG: hypothetical protein R3358_15260, partial [Woeseiaceae bacterium]|nr:hypothetical protein [Woeseiaceae bacterium]
NVEKSEELISIMRETHGPYAPVALGAVYAVRGDNDAAFHWLEKNDFIARPSLEFNPFYENLYDDPRWQPYLESLDERFE